jgi:transcriptional regulator with XRE-family HTH domain
MERWLRGRRGLLGNGDPDLGGEEDLAAEGLRQPGDVVPQEMADVALVLRQLIEEGFSQADIARELGVTRQAIQKMLAC